MDNNETRDLCYRVLQPFKFQDEVVKPFVSKYSAPTYIQLNQGDAEAFAAAGLVSLEDPALSPSPDDEEHCESAAPDCGPVEFHDSEGVPLCRRCYESLADDTSNPDTSTTTTTAETGGSQQDQAAAGEAQTGTDAEKKFDAADSGNTASQESDSANGNAVDAGTPGATEAAPGGESSAGDAVDYESLYGSNNFPALVKIGDQEVQLGDLVAAAHTGSGYTVVEWNGLSEALRDDLIQQQIATRVAALATTAKSAKPAKTKGR